MKVKVGELTGHALDWAVAKCEGLLEKPNTFPAMATVKLTSKGNLVYQYIDGNYEPSCDWLQGGEIIEQNGISLTKLTVNIWAASMPGDDPFVYGDTPLIAAMRCYVASKLGDEVDVPDELTGG